MGDSVRYVPIALANDDSPLGEAAMAKTFFFRSVVRFQLNHYFAKLAPNDQMDPSVGAFAKELPPKDGDRFVFEIATVLPFYLPVIDGQNEFVMTVAGRDYFVCLRMARVFVGQGYPASSAGDYFIAHMAAINGLARSEEGKHGVHVFPFKTFVSHRFEERGASVAEILETHFENWREQLVRDVAQIVDASPSASPKSTVSLRSRISRSYSVPSGGIGVVSVNGVKMGIFWPRQCAPGAVGSADGG
jgi:hypothetical protein